jgi:hypothetical protein
MVHTKWCSWYGAYVSIGAKVKFEKKSTVLGWINISHDMAKMQPLESKYRIWALATSGYTYWNKSVNPVTYGQNVNQWVLDYYVGLTNFLSTIQLAITNCWVLKINYHTFHSDTVSFRFVEPLAVYFTKGNWIMVAFCRLRNDLREFRIDRILNLVTTTDTFTDHHFSFEDYFISKSEK